MLFVENGDTEAFKADRNKLFVSDEKQIDNYTISFDMLHLYMSVVCTYNCRGIFKNIFGVAILFFVGLCSQTATKGSELQFLCTQGTLQGRRVEDHRMMCIRHLCLITLIIYPNNTLHI